jgi:hypothetical protein
VVQQTCSFLPGDCLLASVSLPLTTAFSSFYWCICLFGLACAVLHVYKFCVFYIMCHFYVLGTYENKAKV